ncbi:RNA polymerase sigma factor [Steroidobacter flavus]|uniref:RNA polymerase sigma factor n=1 Tax=Steroidobacter flavus TaxID=1842136 RepID=A0ABV8SYJ7_9GAMM
MSLEPDQRRQAEPAGTAADRNPSVDSSADHYGVVRQLFREHNRALVNFLRTRVASEQEAQDVAQEAYVKLLQLHQPGAVSFLRGYLFRIAANLTVDRARHTVIRHRYAREQVDAGTLDDVTGLGALDVQAITTEEFECAVTALNELSPRLRQAFVKHVVEGYSTSEIAAELGVDERTVRKFVTRAMLHCRERIEADGSRQGE